MSNGRAPELAAQRSHSWARLDGVDLLRGLAIFLVLMNHVNMRLFLAKIPYTQGLPSQLVSSLVWSGQYGVQIFFVVSGFLITSTSIRRWGSLPKVSVRDFYALREAYRGYLPGSWDILWSLSVEEMFYLFFPLVCWLLGGRRWLVVFLLSCAVIGPLGRTTFAHGNEIWREYSYLGGMDAIALGCRTKPRRGVLDDMALTCRF